LVYYTLEAALIDCGESEPQVRKKEDYARLLNSSTTDTHKWCPNEVLNVEALTPRRRNKAHRR